MIGGGGTITASTQPGSVFSTGNMPQSANTWVYYSVNNAPSGQVVSYTIRVYALCAS